MSIINAAPGNDSLVGTAGNDTYSISDSVNQATITDSAGNDTLDLSGRTAGLRIDLAAGGVYTSVPGSSPFVITSQQGSSESVTTMRNGYPIVMWIDTSNNLHGQLYDYLGVQIKPDTVIGSGLPDFTITGLSSGGYLITGDVLDNAGNEIVIGVLTDVVGHETGIPIQINIPPGGLGGDPQATAFNDGRILLTWGAPNSNPNTGNDLYGQWYDASGHAIGNRFQIAATSNDELAQSATVLSDGSFVVTWSFINDSVAQNTPGQTGILAQHYNAGGNPVGNPILIDSSAIGNYVGSASVAPLSNGGFLFAWDKSANGENIIALQRYDAGNTPIGGQTEINIDSGASLDSVSLTALTNHRIALCWSSDTGTQSQINVQLMDEAGNLMGQQILVNTNTNANTVPYPSITPLPDGGFMVTWEDTEDSQLGFTDIMGQRFDANGNKVQPAQIITMPPNGIENAIGGSGSDVLKGTDGNNALWGKAGNDLLDGGAGNDILVGGAGNDVLLGGTGNDRYLFYDGSGKDTIADVSGTDTVDFSPLTANVGVNLDSVSSTSAPADTAVYGSNSVSWNANAIANAVGGSGNDTLMGNHGDNLLNGGAGNDVLYGSLGNDTLVGGTGNDRYVFDGWIGNATVSDSGGSDTMDFSANANNLSIDLNSGKAALLSTPLPDPNQSLLNLSNTPDGGNTVSDLFGQTWIAPGNTRVQSDSHGQYLQFDGIDPVVNTTFNPSGDAFAIHWKERFDDFNSSAYTLMGGKNESLGVNFYNNQYGRYAVLSLSSNSNSWDILSYTGGAKTSYNLNQWYDFELDYSNTGGYKLFVDGTLDIATANTTKVFTPGNIDFGATWVGNYGVHGGLSDVYMVNGSTLHTANFTPSPNSALSGYMGSVSWDPSAIENIVGGSGNDTLTAQAHGNGSLTGGAGDDMLMGGTGNNTYLFSAHNGNDTILDAGGWGDRIQFDGTIDPSQIALYGDSNNNLEIRYDENASDRITVKNATSTGWIERIQLSDGRFLSGSDINTLIQEMSAYTTSHQEGFNSLDDVRNNPNLMAMITKAWHH